jgi:molecular chaperone HscB
VNRELATARAATLGRIASLLDEAGDAGAAAKQVRALMFIERFAHDVEARFDQLGQ